MLKVFLHWFNFLIDVENVFYIGYKCNQCKILYLITTISLTFIYIGYFATNIYNALP